MDYLLAVVLFAISSTITPGPNNIMLMTSGANFGIKKSVPLLLGICIGFTVMILLVGLGFAQLFELYPDLHLITKAIGSLYLLYLAWLIARSSNTVDSSTQSKPFSFITGALFQWVNAKAWVITISAITAFTSSDTHFNNQIITIAFTFLIVSLPCVGSWLIFGSLLKNILKNKRNRTWFNYTMSALLVLSVVPVIKEIIEQVI